MPGQRRRPALKEAVAADAKEEMLLLLFRQMSAHQQRELILEMHAMHEANAISRGKMLKGKPLRTVSNEAVRAAFRDVPSPGAKPTRKTASKKSSKKPGRDLGDAMGDYLDE